MIPITVIPLRGFQCILEFVSDFFRIFYRLGVDRSVADEPVSVLHTGSAHPEFPVDKIRKF
jgi:hypothetical protein